MFLIIVLLLFPVQHTYAAETHDALLRMAEYGIASRDKMDFANSYLALIPDNIAVKLRPHVTILFATGILPPFPAVMAE